MALKKRLQAFLAQSATWKNIALFLLVFLFINIVVLPWAAEKISANGTQPIDLLFSYSPERVFSMVEAYGAARTFYAIFELTGDIIYPLVYSTLFGLILAAIFSRAFSPASAWQSLCFTPFLMGIVDLFENTGIVILLLSYPAQPTLVARLSSLFTSLKWILFGVTVGLVLIGLIMLFVKKLRPAE